MKNGTGQNWFSTGCIDADPLFVDPENNDFHLSLGSPCIDTGDPASPPDPDGSRADMGAYYFEEVQLPGMASDPIPGNNANNIETSQILYWTIGENTETIDLYFGTDPLPVDLVLDNVSAVEIFNPGQLETETTYYWQVDCKNNGGSATGQVWSIITGVNTLIYKTSFGKKFVKVFPNPAKGKVVVKSDVEILSVQLYHSHSNLVFTSGHNDFSITLNISDLASDIYSVKCKTKAGDFSDLMVIR